MQIEQVRRYVLGSLVCSVVLGHSLAVAVLGVTARNQGGARQGLFVIAVLFGVLAIGAVRLINNRSVLTVWLAAAFVIPTATYLIYFKLWV